MPREVLMDRVTTTRAAQMLGRSRASLIRYSKAGFLAPDVHYFRGPFLNSPITWDVERCERRLAELSRMQAPGSRARA